MPTRKLLFAVFCLRLHGFVTSLTGEQLGSATVVSALPHRKLYTQFPTTTS